jgi:hypothetical protein
MVKMSILPHAGYSPQNGQNGDAAKAWIAFAVKLVRFPASVQTVAGYLKNLLYL